jgi:AraC family transcriptional regulator
MDTLVTVSSIRLGQIEDHRVRSFGPTSSSSRISILNGFAATYATYARTGTFSLKWIPTGAACYEVDRVRHRLEGNKILLLSAGQPYELEFLDRRGTESFCVFFSDSLALDALAAVQNEEAPPSARGMHSNPTEVADNVFRPSADMLHMLQRLRTQVGADATAPERLEEELLSLLGDLAATSKVHQHMAATIPAKRSTTRRLILGRLQRAREMIEDHRGRRPALDEIARESGLSKFHLLRLFKAAFDLSPMQYADRCRMERATQLLCNSKLSISRIAELLGFDSPSAFTKMVRRRTGATPRAIRGSR